MITKQRAIEILDAKRLSSQELARVLDYLEALDAAGAFERELPTRQDLIDEADHPRTHDDNPEYIERAIDALIAAGYLKVRP